ncbi:retrovirus-related pol polyprotein LINE-1 [Tanacetum coccineum]|uniref:Retrovirus-related pol polyprotein LINE-1 n=1 Tax=Tanacetum coccineum TaxID=301880 RepID=A0ABQ4WU57_9ASTR
MVLRPCPREGAGGYRGSRRDSRLASSRKIRVGSWNVGTLTGKFLELVDALKRKKVDIACFQETKWKGSRNRERKTIQVSTRVNDELVMSRSRPSHWNLKDKVVKVSDLNGHIGAEADGVSSVHGGFGYGVRNEEGHTFLEFAVTHDLVVVNSFFKKRNAHLITYHSGDHDTQIDYMLVHRGDLRRAISMQGNEADTSATEERYKEAKREAKKAIARAKDKAYEDLYKRLDSKEGENDIYRIAKARQRRKMDLGSVRFIKDEDGRSIVNEDAIRRRWKEYFSALFNGQRRGRTEDVDSIGAIPQNNCYCSRIRHAEVKEALRKMGRNKAVGPDEIPIEAWRCLGGEGVRWLTILFNKTLSRAKMPEEWRLSEVIPIYKNKGDAQTCSNYRGIKLLSHTMKLWERVIERRVRRETEVSENQFGFMPGRSSMEAIHIIRTLMEKYRERQKDLHLAFLDLEKAYDSVPRELIWKTLRDKGTPMKYIKVIQDMLRNGEELCTDATETQSISWGIPESIPWCLIFADDIVLVSDTPDGLNGRFGGSGGRCRKTRTNGSAERRLNNAIDFKGMRTPERILICKHILIWLKWRAATRNVCDKNVLMKLKGKIYRVAIRPAMLYESECWPLTKVQANRMEVAEMRMLRWTYGKTLLDMIPNGAFRRNLQVTTIVNNMREGRLRWFGHVKRRPQSAPVRRVETIVVDDVRRRGIPKLRWEDTLKTDLKELLLSEDMTSDRNSWRTRIRVDEVFLEAVPLSLGRGVTVYISPPPYLALAGLGTVVVVVVEFFEGWKPLSPLQLAVEEVMSE